MEWLLVLDLYIMGAKTESELKLQTIEIKGFSTQKDCEKAGDAAGEIFFIRKGEQNGLMIDCKRSN